MRTSNETALDTELLQLVPVHNVRVDTLTVTVVLETNLKYQPITRDDDDAVPVGEYKVLH